MIQTTGAAAASNARRNAIFDVVPKALLQDVYKQVMKIAEGDAASFNQNRDEAMKWWRDNGAKNADVFKLLGIEGKSDVTIAHLRLLKGMRTAIEEGVTSMELTLNPPEDRGVEKAAGLADKVKQAEKATPQSNPENGLGL